MAVVNSSAGPGTATPAPPTGLPVGPGEDGKGIMRDAEGKIAEKPSDANGTGDVLAVLRHRIAQQELAPGTKLREIDLAKDFGLSRAVIREAFTVLESKGLVERIPNRGAFVANYGYDDVMDLYDLREVLEARAYQLAARNAPDGAWDDLVARFQEKMDESVRNGDADAFVAEIREMDQRVARFAQNRFLNQTLEPIADLTQILLARMLLLPGRLEKGLDLTRQLLAAMTKRDEKAVETIYREMMEVSREYLTKYRQLFF